MTIFSIERRTKEIGIRKSNGARTVEIFLMLNKDFIKWIFVAFIIASPLGYFFASKWLQTYSYKISLHWWLFIPDYWNGHI